MRRQGRPGMGRLARGGASGGHPEPGARDDRGGARAGVVRNPGRGMAARVSERQRGDRIRNPDGQQ